MVRLTSVLGNSQRLDGGAMFGNVPRALWQKWCAPDDRGTIALSCRCFLVEAQGRRVLIETGVGAFFEPKLRERFGVVESEHVLLRSLQEASVSPEEIDVVLLSHLHFDHAGGLLSVYNEEEPARLVFPNARFVVGEIAWQRAKAPHARDRASFIPDLVGLLEGSGRLDIVSKGQREHATLGGSFHLRTSEGHTPGMIVPTVRSGERSATFCADLVPGLPWVHLPITMGYDRFPERLIDEKRALYEDLGPGALLLFTHDPEVAAAPLAIDGKGRYSVGERMAELSGFELV